MIYKLYKNFDGSVSDNIMCIDDDGGVSYHPNAPDNTGWQAYQAWLAADPANQPLPADE